MQVFQLTATRVDGGVCDWDFNPVYSTRERAEKQKANEIKAYTTVNNVVIFDCPYEFEIKEIEVE